MYDTRQKKKFFTRQGWYKEKKSKQLKVNSNVKSCY